MLQFKNAHPIKLFKGTCAEVDMTGKAKLNFAAHQNPTLTFVLGLIKGKFRCVTRSSCWLGLLR